MNKLTKDKKIKTNLHLLCLQKYGYKQKHSEHGETDTPLFYMALIRYKVIDICTVIWRCRDKVI